MLLLSLVPVLIWLTLVLGRGGFWRIKKWMLPLPAAEVPPRSVAVVIPARNESDVIGSAIASLAAQQPSGPLSIFVVDDESDDGTAEIAKRAAAIASATTQVSVIRSRPLPTGWTGKMWAVAQGVEQALGTHPDYVLLTDADIEHPPRSVSTLVALADAEDLSLASVMVKLKTDTLAEKALMPAFTFFFFLLYPPAWTRNPRRKTAGAAGGCMLVRPSALTKAGGMAAIRNEIIDDCALSRIIKRSGGRVWLGISSDIRSLRGYGGAGAIGRMIARTAYNQLHHSPFLLLGTLAGLFVTFLLPLLLLLGTNSAARTLGVVAWLLMTLAYMPTVRFHRLHPLWAVSLPAAAVFYSGATIYSALQFHAGRGGQWKGRAQDAAQVS
jgi:hopene-associated glycosyltransferase HpnB